MPASEALLALALVLTGATQFRAKGLPIGPGELLLILWLGMETLHLLLSAAPRRTPALGRLALFWAMTGLALSIGTVIGLLREPFHDLVGITRDTIAYGLVLTFGVMTTLAFSDPARRRRSIWAFLIVGSISLALQIADGFGALPIPGTDPWYWDRLRGWAENPNQLGFLALVLVLIGLHLLENSRSVRERTWALLVMAPPFMAGVMSLSDSFIIGVIFSAVVYMMLKSIAWVRDTEMAPTLRGAAVVLSVMLMPLALTAAAPFASDALHRIDENSREVYGANEQGETRLLLWTEALEKAKDSWYLGFGPGPHLTSKSYKRPPPSKFEAHNTVFDLLTQAGFVGIAAFFWLIAAATVGAARSGLAALAGLMVGLVVFSMFHFVLRHPIFWYSVVICLLEAAERGRSAASSRGSIVSPGRPDRGRTPERAKSVLA